MRIWFFDKYSRELIPSMEADKGQDAILSPCEPGKFVESIYSTIITPPEFSENETVIFNGTSWEIKSDYRELKAWYKKDGSAVSITQIGIEPDGEYVGSAPEGIVQPVWDETANAWRDKTEKELYAELYASDRDKAVEAMRHEVELLLESKYYRKEFPFKSWHVRADQKSQDILIGYMAQIASGCRGYPIPWITAENKLTSIDSVEEMKTVVNPISAWVEQSIITTRIVKNEIDDAATFEQAWEKFIEYRDAEI